MLGQPSVTQVLAPNLAGQPAFTIDLVTLGIRALTLNTVLAKTAAAAIQLAIGLLMLLPVAPQWRRAALWGSVGWAAIVWVFGRGAGDLLTGTVAHAGCAETTPADSVSRAPEGRSAAQLAASGRP